MTCIDNGMPVVILRAEDLGKHGGETPAELESDIALKRRLEEIRLQAGRRMHLGDVHSRTVPKMCLVSAPRQGGAIATRVFIPHRVHESIGVLGAVSVATACVVPGSIAARVADIERCTGTQRLDIEHPTGFFTIELDVAYEGETLAVLRAALLRTARKLMRGEIFVPERIWSGA